MAIVKINVNQCIENSSNALILDVRSKGEFAQAHFPGAISFPIFDNEERKKVGTAYKQQSRIIAVNIGIKIFKEKMIFLLQEAERLREEYGKEKFIIYCWRGGLRSNTMAWLLQLYGTPVEILGGGYKSFRRWVLQQFERPYNMGIVGGYTGSAKTEVIQELLNRGQNSIDLEGLAHHKGSAFGHINLPEQQRQEHFENKLALQLFELSKNEGPIFLEDESQRIGKNQIPQALYQQMRGAKIYYLDIPFEKRLAHIIDEYGIFPLEDLKTATVNITKNLGGLAAKNVIAYLDDGNIDAAFDILLKYYDKYYQQGLERRENWQKLKINIPCESADEKLNAQKIIDLLK